MQLIALLLVALSAAAVSLASIQISPRVVHESRVSPPVGWKPVRRADSRSILPFRIGLAQSNIENIEAYLLDVSHPDSPNYGKHWSPAKVAETFKPSEESVDTVRAWLASNGVEEHRVKLSSSGGWLHADITVEEAEYLLGTEYHVFESEEGLKHIACSEKYHLPEHVSKHVELITPTLHFDVIEGEDPKLKKRDLAKRKWDIVSPATDGSFEVSSSRYFNLRHRMLNFRCCFCYRDRLYSTELSTVTSKLLWTAYVHCTTTTTSSSHLKRIQ